jgi:hypothetical protein
MWPSVACIIPITIRGSSSISENVNSGINNNAPTKYHRGTIGYCLCS